jgi:hypothetical protein
MFAPQTLRLRVPQQLENKQNVSGFCNLRMFPLPLVLIPVCRLFCAVDSQVYRTLVLGFLSPMSGWVNDHF